MEEQTSGSILVGVLAAEHMKAAVSQGSLREWRDQPTEDKSSSINANGDMAAPSPLVAVRVRVPPGH